MPFGPDDNTMSLTVHRSTLSCGEKVLEEIISFTEFSLDIKCDIPAFSDIRSYLGSIMPPLTLSLTGKIEKIDRVWKEAEE